MKRLMFVLISALLIPASSLAQRVDVERGREREREEQRQREEEWNRGRSPSEIR